VSRAHILVLAFVVSACSAPLDPPPAPQTITQATFEPVYRASKTIQASTQPGVTYLKFGELLQSFATEISIAKDKQMNAVDQKLVGLYDEAMAAYYFSSVLWRLKNEAHDEMWKGEIPVTFSGAPASPEVAQGLAKYELPLIDGRVPYTGAKYQAVSGQSVQIMWLKADEILKRATEMYYGRSTGDQK
jgi:hypothetical protein